MTDLHRPANRETAFGNARALCCSVEPEGVFAAFDAAMDMACWFDEFLRRCQAAGRSRPAGPAPGFTPAAVRGASAGTGHRGAPGMVG